MEQGTGKTLPAIGVSGYRFQEGQVSKLLVVAPLSVVSVWEDEFSIHAMFNYHLIDLSRRRNDQRKSDLALEVSNSLQVAIINYESAWRCIDLLKKWHPDMIIADESQKIKNGRKKQSRALHKLGDLVQYKMILTGTPITQGPLDTWSQYRFLNPDIFGKRFLDFRDRYAVMGGYMGYEIKRYKHLNELARKAHSIAYRITKSEALDLPETTDQILTVNLSPSTMKLYKKMEKDFLIEFSDNEIATAPIILTQLLRLQQITGGFIPTDEGEIKKLDSTKLNTLKELLEDLPINKKVVIFARFISEIESIKKISQSLGRNPVVLSGGVKSRSKVIRDFQNNPRIKDIVIQIQTGGLGISLTAADTAILYSTTFGYADYDQAKARLHRIGQKNPVTYIHILAGGTVDEEILQTLMDKADMASQIVDRLKKRGEYSTKVPFRNPSDSFILKRNKGRGGTNRMIALDKKPKGGWYWDEETGRIVRMEAGDKEVDFLCTANTLEEAQEIVDKLAKKTISNLMEGDESEMAGKKDRKKSRRKEEAPVAGKKKTKKQRKTEQPEEVMEEAVEELEEVVEDEAEEEQPKTKKAKKAKKGKKAKTEEAPTKKAKKSKKAKKAAPAPEKKATKAEAGDNEITAKELAAQLNIDPKVLRKTLREMFPDHESKERWVWKKGSKELNSLIKKLQK